MDDDDDDGLRMRLKKVWRASEVQSSPLEWNGTTMVVTDKTTNESDDDFVRLWLV